MRLTIKKKNLYTGLIILIIIIAGTVILTMDSAKKVKLSTTKGSTKIQ